MAHYNGFSCNKCGNILKINAITGQSLCIKCQGSDKDSDINSYHFQVIQPLQDQIKSLQDQIKLLEQNISGLRDGFTILVCVFISWYFIVCFNTLFINIT